LEILEKTLKQIKIFLFGDFRSPPSHLLEKTSKTNKIFSFSNFRGAPPVKKTTQNKNLVLVILEQAQFVKR